MQTNDGAHGVARPTHAGIVFENRSYLIIMPKTHRHLFEQIIALPNLFAAARDAMRGKRSRDPAAAFFADLDAPIRALVQSWRSLTGVTAR